MPVFRTLFTVSLLACSLAACDGEAIIGEGNGMDHLILHNGIVTAGAAGQPDATINATGDLRIGDKAVDETPAQRDLLRKYFSDVVAIRSAGIATGKAGAAMAGKAVSAVVAGLAHGDPDSIGPKVDAQAKDIQTKALAICDSLANLQTAQDAVASALPAFKPYATIDSGQVDDCRKDSRAHHH